MVQRFGRRVRRSLRDSGMFTPGGKQTIAVYKLGVPMKQSVHLLPLVGVALSPACTGQQPRPKAIVIAVGSGPVGTCSLTVDGQQLNGDELTQMLRKRGRNQPVVVTGLTLDVPYRCVGSVVYSLQGARVEFKLGFISEPPPAGPDAR